MRLTNTHHTLYTSPCTSPIANTGSAPVGVAVGVVRTNTTPVSNEGRSVKVIFTW